jgi:DNA helicase-2/ATP-dependent DNA helicase PcrA
MQMSNQLRGVDKDIFELINLDNPKSFLLFAGAGAGKTRTLVNVLVAFKKYRNDQLINSGKRIAVITYTNAACEEIKHRLNYDTSFDISTIHSFAWLLVQPFTKDIKDWLRSRLDEKIIDLQDKLAKARDLNNKTAILNRLKLEKSLERKEKLNEVFRFIYSPVEILSGKGALNHAEVIGVASFLLQERPLLQKILIKKYPVLLIDESQDTSKHLLDALIQVQKQHRKNFSLGIIGDQMQSIYSGGKQNIKDALPDDWKVLEKVVNYRSPKRIIDLINAIRYEEDGWKQEYFRDDIGTVRLFIVNSNLGNQYEIEKKVKNEMNVITGDYLWEQPTFVNEEKLEKESVKCLTLEHAMAAIRGAFADFLVPLLTIDRLRDGSIDGTRREFAFFGKVLVPFTDAVSQKDDFSVMNILKKHSTLVSGRNPYFTDNPLASLKSTGRAVTELEKLLSIGSTTIFDVLSHVQQNKLFEIPEELEPSMHAIGIGVIKELEAKNESISAAWDNALTAPFSQLEKYVSYVSGTLGFATHQGVKGLEFDRVLAILDDEQAKGFLFSYEKLFGAEPKSKTDLSNEETGKDSAISRTRRLFYVICSRAQKSLAVVAYTKEPEALRDKAIESWFKEDEIVML